MMGEPNNRSCGEADQWEMLPDSFDLDGDGVGLQQTLIAAQGNRPAVGGNQAITEDNGLKLGEDQSQQSLLSQTFEDDPLFWKPIENQGQRSQPSILHEQRLHQRSSAFALGSQLTADVSMPLPAGEMSFGQHRLDFSGSSWSNRMLSTCTSGPFDAARGGVSGRFSGLLSEDRSLTDSYGRLEEQGPLNEQEEDRLLGVLLARKQRRHLARAGTEAPAGLFSSTILGPMSFAAQNRLASQSDGSVFAGLRQQVVANQPARWPDQQRRRQQTSPLQMPTSGDNWSNTTNVTLPRHDMREQLERLDKPSWSTGIDACSEDEADLTRRPSRSSSAPGALETQTEHLKMPAKMVATKNEAQAPATEATNDSALAKSPTSPTKKKVEMPRRPLSGYNFFFSEERARILAAAGLPSDPQPLLTTSGSGKRPPARRHRKTHGKISFQELARTVAKRWKELNADRRQYYQDRNLGNSQRPNCILNSNYRQWYATCNAAPSQRRPLTDRRPFFFINPSHNRP